MKKFFNKLWFLFKISLRNILSSKLRAFVLFFSSTIIVILFFTVFSLNTFFAGYFEAYFKNEKGNSDIYITIDENYGSRYFSIRNLEESLDDDYYDYTVGYFKIASLSYIDEDYSYVDIVMANLNEFKQSGNFSEYPYNLLESDEIIITKSFADNKLLKVEDTLFLQMGSEKISFRVVAIVEDGGLIKGSTVFIDKNSNIKNILAAMYPELENLNPAFFNKLCNGAYIYTNGNIENSEVVSQLYNIEEYQNLNIAETINKDNINVFVNRNIAYFFVGIVLILISILFVVHSSLTVVFNDRLKQLGIIKSLGGKEKDFLLIIIFEIAFYLLLAIIIGPVLCLLLLRFGLGLVDSNYIFKINFVYLLYTFISLNILYGFLVLFSYLKVKELAINNVIKTTKFKSINWINTLLIFAISIIMFIFNNVFLKENALLKYRGIINFSLIVIIGIVLAKILFGLSRLLFKKNSLFGLIFIDDVNRNKITRSIIIVLLVAFTSIVTFVGLSRVDERRITKLYDETKVDLVITNIIKEEDLEVFLSNNNKVEHYDKGILYNNVILNNEKSFLQMISVKNFDNYYNFEIEISVLNKLNTFETAVVLAPIEYKYLYNYSIGDELILSLSELYDNESFEIIGFFDSEYEDIIITNLYLLDGYESALYNSVFINSNNKNLLKNELTDKYSKNLYYIIDFEEFINEIDIYTTTLRNFLSFIALFFIFCFIFTILNNSILLFESNKKIFARLKIIGCTKRNLAINIIYQYLLIVIICVFSSFFAVFIIMSNVKYILLFFNVYQEVNLVLSDYLIGYCVSIIVFFISYLYYMKLALNVDINVAVKELD